MKPIVRNLAIAVGVMGGVMHAELARVTSIDDFGAAIVRKPLAVVLFYQKDERAKEEKEALKTMIKSLKAVLKAKARQRFIAGITVAVDKAPDLAHQFGIEKTPVLMLFKEGKPYKVDGAPVTLVGYSTSGDMLALINDSYAEDLHRLQKQYQQEELYKAQLRAYYSWAWGPYWGGPYGPYYYPGWRWGWYW